METQKFAHIFSAFGTHRFRAKVAVAPGSIPIAHDGFGIEGDDDVMLFRDALQNVTRHPKLIRSVDSLRWPDLKLCLTRHHFQVNSANVHIAVETRPNMGQGWNLEMIGVDQ